MKNCIFCKIVAHEIPSHTVYENEDVIAFLDIRPQSRGHLQLVPKKHYRWVYDLPDIGKFFATAQRIIRGIIPALGASHVRLATFGEEVPHAHLWIVPQYGKGTELKEGAGSASEDLEEVARILRNSLQIGKVD